MLIPKDIQTQGNYMQKLLIFIFSLLSFLNTNSAQAQELKTVDHVDLKRYMGEWYEIARTQNSWQRECAHNTKATYHLRPDGIIDVENQCQTGPKKTDLQVTNGTAKVVDTQTNAKLKVTFNLFEKFKWEFSGDYWIIFLDPDYQIAAVSEPTQTYLWILSRKPQMSEDAYAELLGKVAVLMPNLNVLNVLRTKQDNN